MSRSMTDDQVALRRLATLVAQGVSPIEVFDAVAREMGKILHTKHVVVARYESEGKVVTALGAWNPDQIVPPGSRWEIEKGTVSELVFRTKAPGRINSYEGDDRLSRTLREGGLVSSVGCPIVVRRCLWGVVVASSSTPRPLPADTEERMRNFSEIMAIAIANAQSSAELKASRLRLVAAADEARRRIERDLHDGTQQRLVALKLEVRGVQDHLPEGCDEVEERLCHMTRSVDEAIEDLREISRGVHPGILAKGGLGPALKTLARASSVTVELNMSTDRKLSERIEVTVYYVVSEALTNVTKYAHASTVFVDLTMSCTTILLRIRDDGVGGADPACGSGLLGLIDRVEAIGGSLTIESPVGLGTLLTVQIPTERNEDPTVLATR